MRNQVQNVHGLYGIVYLMPASGDQERIQPFSGDWLHIEPPAGLVDRVGQLTLSLESRKYYPRCVLAISRAVAVYFGDHPDQDMVTLLSHTMEVLRPDATNIQLHARALLRGLSIIGGHIMSDSGRLVSSGRFGVVAGALESPVATFAHTRLGGEAASKQIRYPEGLGYVAVGRTTHMDNVLVGWCAPSDGRRSEVPVDVASVRSTYPTLQPVSRLVDGGGPF
jgi:hypothetical protein